MLIETFRLKTKYSQCQAMIEWKRYGNGRIAMVLMNADTGEPEITATVNLVDDDTQPGEVAIKDYSGNEGVLDCLVRQAIVAKPHRYVVSGYVTFPICRLLVEPK